MEICRLCLTMTKTNAVLTYQEIIEKIKECVSIEISHDETFPKQVCDICLERVNNWYEFKKMCLRSKIILENEQIPHLDTLNSSNRTKTIQENTQIESPNTAKQEEYKTRRNSVIINNSRNIAPNVELIGDWEIIVNPEDQIEQDFNIPSKDFDSLETDCKIKQLSSYTEDNIEPQIYNCEFCSQSFEYYTDYLDHQNDHNGEAVFHCAKCKMTFLSKSQLAQHEKSHKIPCEICGTLVQKQSMKLHLNKHTDRFKCTQCPLTFSCGPLLRDHITARHMKLKLHCCDFCGKDFASKSSLVLHLKTHSDVREYKCGQCDYAGRTSVALRIHISKHENNTCICEYCSKIFKSYRNLNDHLKRVHTSQKKHACEFCGMKFALRYLVEQHKRTHTGIHPYKCSKCSKTFARSDGLKEHMKTHNRTEIFKCSVCTKSFLTARGVKRHNCVLWSSGK